MTEKKIYITSRDECAQTISVDHVCEGCGGKLEPLETVDNAGNPTFWKGCLPCGNFRNGIEGKYFNVSRKLVEDRVILPFDLREEVSRDYFLKTQISELSFIIKKIDRMLREGEAK